MEYEYQVCLSFAGEQRDYVSAVNEALIKLKIKAFYDKNLETKLWGSNLIEVFHNVYKKKAKYCVMFISKEYKEKAWTHFERISALERQIYSDEAYILPVRFDDTELPGLSEGILYLNANEMSPQEIACKIAAKIDENITPDILCFDILDYTKSIYEKVSSLLKEVGYHQSIKIIGTEIFFFTVEGEKEISHLLLRTLEPNKIIVKNIDFFCYSITEKIVTEIELYQLIKNKLGSA